MDFVLNVFDNIIKGIDVLRGDSSVVLVPSTATSKGLYNRVISQLEAKQIRFGPDGNILDGSVPKIHKLDSKLLGTQGISGRALGVCLTRACDPRVALKISSIPSYIDDLDAPLRTPPDSVSLPANYEVYVLTLVNKVLQAGKCPHFVQMYGNFMQSAQEAMPSMNPVDSPVSPVAQKLVENAFKNFLKPREETLRLATLVYVSCLDKVRTTDVKTVAKLAAVFALMLDNTYSKIITPPVSKWMFKTHLLFWIQTLTGEKKQAAIEFAIKAYKRNVPFSEPNQLNLSDTSRLSRLSRPSRLSRLSRPSRLSRLSRMEKERTNKTGRKKKRSLRALAELINRFVNCLWEQAFWRDHRNRLLKASKRITSVKMFFPELGEVSVRPVPYNLRYIFSEYVNSGTLEDLVTFSKLQPIQHRVILFQVIFSLYVLHTTYPGFRHNDLHTNNILVNVRGKASKRKKQIEMKLNDYYRYHVKDFVLNIPDVGIVCKIWDFDASNVSGVRNQKAENQGLTDVDSYYDLCFFLNCFILGIGRSPLSKGFSGDIMNFYTQVLKEAKDAGAIDPVRGKPISYRLDPTFVRPNKIITVMQLGLKTIFKGFLKPLPLFDTVVQTFNKKD